MTSLKQITFASSILIWALSFESVLAQRDANWGAWTVIEESGPHLVEMREGDGPTTMAPPGAKAHYYQFRNSFDSIAHVTFRLRIMLGGKYRESLGDSWVGAHQTNPYSAWDANEFSVSDVKVTVGRVSPEQRRFEVTVRRKKAIGGLLAGTLTVNGIYVGTTVERVGVAVEAGRYLGLLRYVSPKGMAQGPFGTYATKGDFLLEAAGVHGKTNILFHGGTLPRHSDGCIVLGPVGVQNGKKYVFDAKGPLYRLRTLFYGSDVPLSTPAVQIDITVEDP